MNKNIKRVFGDVEFYCSYHGTNYVITKGLNVYKEIPHFFIVTYELVNDPPEPFKEYIKTARRLHEKVYP